VWGRVNTQGDAARVRFEHVVKWARRRGDGGRAFWGHRAPEQQDYYSMYILTSSSNSSSEVQRFSSPVGSKTLHSNGGTSQYFLTLSLFQAYEANVFPS
jgi:hypothetical protein